MTKKTNARFTTKRGAIALAVAGIAGLVAAGGAVAGGAVASPAFLDGPPNEPSSAETKIMTGKQLKTFLTPEEVANLEGTFSRTSGCDLKEDLRAENAKADEEEKEAEQSDAPIEVYEGAGIFTELGEDGKEEVYTYNDLEDYDKHESQYDAFTDKIKDWAKKNNVKEPYEDDVKLCWEEITFTADEQKDDEGNPMTHTERIYPEVDENNPDYQDFAPAEVEQ